MKLQLTLKKAFITLLFVGISAVVFAQGTGKIAGTVADKKTGEALIGAAVKIVGTTKAVGTDVDGKYILGGLAEGKYTLEITYVTYSTKRITDVEVKSNATTTLNIVMDESSQTLNQIVVTASFKQESVNSLYAQQKNSAVISDGISSDQIKRSPDKNTSEALRRISGATIQDNKFVVVRGLSDRYNSASLDNSTLPSTEPNRKAFSFDIVPSNLVDKITISKTATPDLPADFAGGAVQITTKDIPDQNFLSFGLGYGYNSQSTFKDFLGTGKNALNYLGYDNGSKQLADNFPTKNRVITGLTPARNIGALKSLPNDFRINNNAALPSQSYQFNIGRVKQFENNNRFGALFSLTYRNSQNTNRDVKRDFYEYDYNDNQYKFSTNIGALANFAYSFGKNKISFKNIYNKTYDDNYTERAGIDNSSTTANKFYAYDVMQKSLLKSTLEGDHQIGTGKSKLKWSASYSNVKNNQPNQLKIIYMKPIAAQNDPSVPYQANITSLGKENSRLFSDLDENIYSGDVNYSTAFKLFNAPTTFKVGLGSQYRERTFTARFLGAILNTNDPDQQKAIRTLPVDQIFSPSLIESGVYKLGEIANDADNYDANSLNNYGYGMLDQKFGDKHRVIYGLRIENYQVRLNTNKPIVDDTKLDILPSVNYTYNINAKSNFRASYYRTLARPEFRELAPFSFYDYELLALQGGNSNLKRTSIDNADLRYETYPGAGEILSASVFYKHFTNAIESYRYDVNSTPDISYFNTAKAFVYGIELEARKKLTFIGNAGVFKNTTAYLNLSLIKSEVKNPEDQKYIDKVRPMVGQSPYVINAGLQHSALENKLNFNLLYNRIGRSIIQASGINFPSTWEAPRNVIDFQAGYKVMKTRGELKLNVADILSERNTIYFDYNKNKKFDTNGGDETIMSYKPGTNVSLSFTYSF
ncbi:TonB-dependent receptor domain-containing protein [Pedobacter sp. UC225_65]|uniref:TonB-dependent receptor n=1 Tax=Pedobacter sp. UC225_65 TaxID=3350173 RepID=UPI00367158E0